MPGARRKRNPVESTIARRRTVAGFPFRLEVRCEDASVALCRKRRASHEQRRSRRSSARSWSWPRSTIRSCVIAEFAAPATIADRGASNHSCVNWSKGRSSVVGLPDVPQRASIVFDDPRSIASIGSIQVPLAGAKHVELHGRIAEGSPSDSPVIETALQIAAGSIKGCIRCSRRRSTPTCGRWSTACGIFRQSPGRSGFVKSRPPADMSRSCSRDSSRASSIAVATGSLGLSPSGVSRRVADDGRGSGEGRTGARHRQELEQGVPQATLDRVAPGVHTQDINNLMGALDRAIPGLGKVVRQNANVGVAAGISALGKEAVLEGGRRASSRCASRRRGVSRAAQGRADPAAVLT